MLEFSLRYIVGLGDPVLYDSYPLYGYRLRPNQAVKRFGDSIIKVNNLGLRADRDWDNNIANKVLFLGDSVTYGGSYISNDELFSHLALEHMDGYMSGNAAINGWGVDNIYGLIMSSEFLPSAIYVTVIPEDDFYRGLQRFVGKPYWNHKPKFAAQELLYYILFRVGNSKYDSWQSLANNHEIEKVVNQAVFNLHQLDDFLSSRGFKHLIYISPTRNQVLNREEKDQGVQKILREYKINVVYLLDRLNNMEFSSKEIDELYYDYIHLSKKGHRLWADMIAPDLKNIIER